jgi:hypothetical protein
MNLILTITITIIILLVILIIVYSIFGSDKKNEDPMIYKAMILDNLKKEIPDYENEIKDGPNLDMKSLREYQMKDMDVENKIVKYLAYNDIEGFKELHHFVRMLQKFFVTYARIFNRDETKVLVKMMMGNLNQGGSVGKDINDLKDMLSSDIPDKTYKKGDKRVNHRELTQIILTNYKDWCQFIWLLIAGLVKQNPNVMNLIVENDINVDNINLRIKLIQSFMLENINHIITTLCPAFNINNGIPTDACSKGPRGIEDYKCDPFCTGRGALCDISIKCFSYFKKMGKDLNPKLDYEYSEYKNEEDIQIIPKPSKLKIDSLNLPLSKREISFFNELAKTTKKGIPPGYSAVYEWSQSEQDNGLVPWSSGVRETLNNPGNPMSELSASRNNLSVTGTSGHGEAIMSIAVLFNRYKDPQKLKNLVRGILVSLAPHHHSIREMATSAYASPYNVDFDFSAEGPMEIIQNLL